MKYCIHNKELWVLVEVYISMSGFVAHWFSHSGGKHWHEPINVQFRLKCPRQENTARDG